MISSNNQKRIRVTFWIPKELMQAVREIAAIRRVSFSSVLVESIKTFVEGVVGTESDGRLGSDLGRIDRRVRNIAIDVEVLGEMMALYVYHWLCHQNSLPESQRKAASIEGRERYEKFLELVKDRRVSHRSVWRLLYDIPQTSEPMGASEKQPLGEDERAPVIDK
jgi:hypothetical protein